MRIAITGATGFIGGYMVRGMSRVGHTVRVLVRSGRESAVEHPPERACELHVGDLTDPASLAGFLDSIVDAPELEGHGNILDRSERWDQVKRLEYDPHIIAPHER